jgi:hypothetical protein
LSGSTVKQEGSDDLSKWSKEKRPTWERMDRRVAKRHPYIPKQKRAKPKKAECKSREASYDCCYVIYFLSISFFVNIYFPLLKPFFPLGIAESQKNNNK